MDCPRRRISNNKIFGAKRTDIKGISELVKILKRKGYVRETPLDKPLCYIRYYGDCKGIVENRTIVEQFKKSERRSGKSSGNHR